MNKKALYESIMKTVAKKVKAEIDKLNESLEDVDDVDWDLFKQAQEQIESTEYPDIDKSNYENEDDYMEAVDIAYDQFVCDVWNALGFSSSNEFFSAISASAPEEVEQELFSQFYDNYVWEDDTEEVSDEDILGNY